MLRTPPWLGPISPRFLRFLAVGVINTAWGYGVFLLLLQLPLPLWLVMLISHVLGVLFNFKTTGKLVFGSHDNRLVGRFVAGYVATYFINLAALKGLIALGIPVVPASAALLLPMAVLSYTIGRFFVFRDGPPQPSEDARPG